jgi:acetoin utilization protein AcuC
LSHLGLTLHGFETLFQRLHTLSPRWLALGGGGYDRSVVPRAWTLAWGVMSGQNFADTLPEPIAAHYDPPLLRENTPAPLSDSQRQQARRAVEQVVGELKKLFF